MSYLIAVQMASGSGSPGVRTKEWRRAMSILMNRMLDVMVSFAVVGLALTAAGATAVLGA
jgi:hypothetical protein